MEIEIYSHWITTLAGTFAFVCSLWAICMPSIREHPGSYVGFSRIAWGILGGMVLLFCVTGIWELLPIDYGDNPPSETSTLGERLFGFTLMGVFASTGVGLVLALKKLSNR